MHEKRFLLITSFLIVLIGAPAVLSVVREPVTARAVESVTDSLAASSGASETTVKSPRQPASIPTQTLEVSPRNAIHSRSVVMDYDCNQKGGNMEVDGTLLRLKGQDFTCLNDKWTDVSITNHSNGFTASVIFLKKGFTTDFIDLKEGENNLEIQAKDDKGQQVTKKFTVKRRAIASVEGSSK